MLQGIMIEVLQVKKDWAPVNGKDIINELLPNGWVFLAHVVATVIILFLVIFLMWKPLNTMLAKRYEYINGQIKDADKAKQNAIASQQNANDVYLKARFDSERIVDAARLEGYKVREELETNAKQYATRLKQDAADDIKRQEKELKRHLNTEISTIATHIAKKIINENITTKINEKLVDDFIKEFEAKPINEK